MNLTSLWRPVLLYTILFGLLTVAAVYFLTHSGLYLLIAGGVGLLLAVLGGGAAGTVDSSGTEPVDGDGIGGEATGLMGATHRVTSLRLVLLCYGSGVFLWSLAVLVTLRDTLG
jgi:hypothetical protein